MCSLRTDNRTLDNRSHDNRSHDNRSHDDTFESSPLVAWIRSYVGATSVTAAELSSGLLLHDVLTHVDSHAFAHLRIQYSVHDVTTRAHNLMEIFNGVRQFYLEKLQQLVVIKVIFLNNNPNTHILLTGNVFECDP